MSYLGDISNSTKETITKICKLYCKETHVSLIFKSFKVLDCFLKTKIPEYLRSYIVCEFVYAGCNATFVGKTQRHIKTRINGYLHLGKKSYVFQHLAGNESHECNCNESYFRVTDIVYYDCRLKLKGTLHIKWRKPTLDVKKQQVCLLISL